MTRIRIFFVVVLFAIITTVYAEESDPIRLLEKVTAKVMVALDDNKDEIKVNPNKIYEVVDHLVLPYIDFTEMSRWVAGRTAWGKASPVVQTSFVSEFKILVVRTYATALNNYSNERVEFLPQEITSKKTRVQISSWIKRIGKENIRVDYRLIRFQDTWRVYDIIIEGVSILQGFQAQFSNDIRQKGLDAVTQKIKTHNSNNKLSEQSI